MNNFYKCAEGVDVVPLMMALKANAHLWNQNRGTPPDLLFVFS